MTRDSSRLEQALNAALEPGERLLWSGFPRRGAIFHARDILLIPLGLVWLCLAISWEVVLFVGEPDIPDQFDIWDIGFVIWGIPFILAGLYFVFGRFVTDARARANTVYGLSDRRILILKDGRRRKLRTLELSGLREMHLTEERDGRGTIGFGPAFYGQASVGTGGAAFHGIPAARDVLKQIRDAKHNART